MVAGLGGGVNSMAKIEIQLKIQFQIQLNGKQVRKSTC